MAQNFKNSQISQKISPKISKICKFCKNFTKNHFHLLSVGGIVVWLILWILDKMVGFSKAVKESHLLPFAYLAVVAFLAVFIAIKSYKNISNERKTTLYFERQVKDYAG